MTLSVTISNAPVVVLEQTLSPDFTSDGRSVVTFNVLDLTGTIHFQPGQPVKIVDTVQGYTFFSYINDSQETPMPPQVAITHTINCVDGHYIADKRFYAGPEYKNRYAGDIAADLVNKVLAQEGVITSGYAVDNDQSQADWAEGSLNGTVAANTIPGGDLELAPAGPATIISESGSVFSTGTVNNTQVITTPPFDPVLNPLMPVVPIQALGQKSFDAIKIVGIQSLNNGGNTYTYYQIEGGGGFTVSNPQYFAYDMWIDPASPTAQISIDMVFTDGTTWRDTAVNPDAQFIYPHPSNDLTGLATGQWYHRVFGMGNYSGKTVNYVSIGIEGDKVGTYTAYFKNLYWDTDPFGTHQTAVWTGGAIGLSGQLQNYGYESAQVSVVKCYNDQDFRWTPSVALSQTGIVASTNIVWSAIETWSSSNKNGSLVEIGYSLDGGNSFIRCTNGKPLPNFPAGLSVAGLSIQFIQFLLVGNTPEETPYLTQFEFQANPGYTGTKTDVIYHADSPTDWSAGTFSNTTNNGGFNLSLSGFTRNWDTADTSNQDIFGAAGWFSTAQNKQFALGCAAGNDARSRLTFAGTWQNFTMEVDVQVSGNYDAGMEYRTTNWGNNKDSYAYMVTISTTQLIFGKGTNTTGAGAFTGLGTATLSLTAGDLHRLKIVVSGNSHTFYVDNTQLLQVTDASWTAAGNVALRIFNHSASGQTAHFDNWGIAPALSGTWVSPSISLNSAAAYSNSDFYYANNNDLSNVTVLTEITTNGGSTWTAVNANSALIVTATGLPFFTVGQSLTGVNLKIRITITVATVTVPTNVNSLWLKILGSFSASASRTTEGLSLNGVGVCGSAQVSWTGIQPLNALQQSVTGIFVDTSLDGINWTNNVAPGQALDFGSTTYTGFGAIAGITTPDEPIIDEFDTDSSIDYTSTYEISNVTTGAIANWNWDTANSRLTTSSANSSLLLYNAPTMTADVDISCIMDKSDNGGFVWRFVDQGNFYFLTIDDNNGGSPNTVGLFKVVSGIRTQIGATIPISFSRGTPHAFRLTMVGNTITATMDGLTVITATDNDLVAAGFAGLRADSFGGAINRFYLLRIAYLGQAVDTLTVYTRVRLTSTDPTITPQVLDLATSVRNGNIQDGILIPAANYSILMGNKITVASILDDLCTQCGNFWWRIGGTTQAEANQLFFQAHQSLPAPFPITANDVLVDNLQFDNINDHYRNDMWINNGKDAIADSKSFLGDTIKTAFDVTYPIDSITSISLNNVAQTFGIKGVDTGRQWYWTQGSTSVVQDTSSGSIPINGLQTLTINYNGQMTIQVNVQSPSEIARMKAIDGTTGIISEAVISSSHKGKGANKLNKAACIQLGSGLLDTYAQPSTTATFSTLRPGLAVGQLICIFNVMGRFAMGFLVSEVKIDWKTSVVNGVSTQQPWYDITAISGPVVGDFTRFVSNLSIM